MEKLEKKHHDHKFTEWLKNIIFGLVMLAPLLSIAVRCMYTIFNKNAKDSYYGNTVNDKEYVHTDYDALEIGETYQITPINIGTQSSEMGSSSYRLTVNNVEAINFTPNVDLNEVATFSLYSTTTGLTYINLKNSLGNDLLSLNSSNGYTIKYQLVSKNLIGNSITLFNLLNNNKIIYNNYSYLDNAFSYSVNQLSNDSIFNWTRNTGIYQPINAMVSGLEIENDTLQIMLAYWSLMTAVYIVFDLIIFCFTKLTHFING